MEVKRLILAVSFLLGSFSGFSSFAQSSCEVPVCDIPAKIEELKSQGPTERAQIMKNLRIQYRGTTSAQVWENLKQFSAKGEALFIELKDEDWVIREAIYLQNASRVGLIKFAPIEKDRLIENFAGLRDEGSSFEVLNYWAVEVEKIDDPDQVLALVSFGEYARQWAITTKQEAYVVREADKLILSGGTRVSKLRPAHEGLFKISVHCDPRPSDCLKQSRELTHLTVMDTLNARGLVVALSESKTGRTGYLFTTAELTKNGTHVRGLSTEATPYTRVAEVLVDINPLNGEVSGTLKDEAFPGVIRFTGTPVRRLANFFTDEGPARIISEDQVLGRYQGRLGDNKADLVVSHYTDGQLVGVITYANKTLVIPLKSGDYNSKHGVLSLTGMGAGIQKSDRKLVLALRKDKKDREVLKGFLLLSTPRHLSAEFYRMGDR